MEHRYAARVAVLAWMLVALAFIAEDLTVTPAFAEPPAWAPAHGYRAKQKHKRKYKHRRKVYREEPEYHREPARVEVSPVVTFPSTGYGHCNRELLGSIIGGATGAAVGSHIGKGDGRALATIGGIIIGAIVGGHVGNSMDEVDQNCVGHALELAPTGRAVEWQNPDNGAEYRVTPTRTYESSGGEYCREYQTKIVVGGKVRDAYGTACRQPDGSWKTRG